ncbi:MAG TPA: adenylate/guanylate cyclase domain-containing protein [Burkholderiales bacterium]|nr:adenylate/guanylate cyclase domain-containing protein [Burkholderiales bacterium]
MSPSGIPDFQNRTLICSVLFIDIVEYSRKSVVEQGRLKDRFNARLSEALRDVAINDRIILDTGDGAAISFIGDPADALFVATALRDLIENLPQTGDNKLSTRMGINLGPVRLVKDINGQPNIVGDGINVAQRVMTFAKPGQVLVSRSYYEVVSRLSQESSKLFSCEGARKDEHIREHEVYAVGSSPPTRRLTDPVPGGEWQSAGQAGAAGGAAAGVAAVLRKPAVASVLAIVAIIATAVVARAYRETHEPLALKHAETVTPKPAAPIVPISDEPPARIRGLPPEPVERRAQAAADADVASASKKAPGREKQEKPKTRERSEPREDVARREPSRPAPPAQAPIAARAMLSFAVSPWGEVHVDGKMHGVSPPLQELELPPGRHRVEIKNSASQPHVVTVNAKAGERIRIKHKFD